MRVSRMIVCHRTKNVDHDINHWVTESNSIMLQAAVMLEHTEQTLESLREGTICFYFGSQDW